MKKGILFLLFVLVFGVTSSFAGLRFGLKAGANISKVTFSSDVLESSNITGFQVGPILEFNFPVIGLGLDGAVLYSQRGLKSDVDEYKTDFIDIPLNLKYKISVIHLLGFYLSAGPYASFQISGDDNFKTIVDDVQETWDAKTFQAGLNFGAGVELFSKLQVGVNYQLGLTDDYSAGSYDARNATWAITAAYFF